MKYIKTGLATTLLAISVSSHASDQTGKIVNLSVRASDGLIMINMDGVRSTRPACAVKSYWVIKDEASSAGKMQYAALLAAKISGATVALVGASQCTRWPDGEDVNVVYVQE